MVDWDNSLVILLMGFFDSLFHCFDRLWSGSGSRGRCRSWFRGYDHSYIDWLLFFLNRF